MAVSFWTCGPAVLVVQLFAEVGSDVGGARAEGEDAGFVVQRVGTAEDNGVLTVGIAAAPDATGRCLLFSIQIDAADDENVADELDTYCITDEAQSTTYGGVVSCLLAAQELTLTFTAEAARQLHLNPRCRFPLRVDEESVEQLRSGLRRVLTGGRNDRMAPSELVL
jgi:hypothetical protein